jgi:hypothetical protein
MDKIGFRAYITSLINRGPGYDSAIDAAGASAVNWLENNQNMRYMHKRLTFNKDPNGSAEEASPEVNLGRNVKRFTSVRVPDPARAGFFQPVIQVDPVDIESIPAVKRPEFFYTTFNDSNEMIMTLGALAFDAAFLLEVFAYVKTDYAGLGDTDGHWLFDNAFDWLVGRTMWILAPAIRQAELAPAWKAQADEGLVSLNNANAELEQGVRDERLGYTGEVSP